MHLGHFGMDSITLAGPIEGKLKATCPYLSQVIIHGDKRNFVTALVTLDEEPLMKWARDKMAGKSYSDVAQSPEAKALLSPYFDDDAWSLYNSTRYL